MGILNVTPDSFFDKGRFFDEKSAIERGVQLYRDGADILDIGGESTRPGADSVCEKEELQRVIPVIRALKQEIPIPLSVDTKKAAVAMAAIEAGATFINDVTGFQHVDMQEVACQSQADLCLMHMQGTPRTMQQDPHYPEGIIPYLLNWFEGQIELLVKKGVSKHRILIDPGIGFGKTVAHNIEIIQNLGKLKAFGLRVLIGISRKSFMSKILNKPATELLPATLAVNTLLIRSSVDMIRVHDVKEHRDVIDLLASDAMR